MDGAALDASLQMGTQDFAKAGSAAELLKMQRLEKTRAQDPDEVQHTQLHNESAQKPLLIDTSHYQE